MSEIRLLDDLPVTSPVQTTIDIASELDPIAVERAVNDADKRDLIDPDGLRLALEAHAGEPGVRPLRQILDRLTFRLSDSDLEIFLRPIAASAGLPSPLSKHRVNGFEVDFFWPELGLVVETDGLRYHRTPSAQKRDTLRNRAPARSTQAKFQGRSEVAAVRPALGGIGETRHPSSGAGLRGG